MRTLFDGPESTYLSMIYLEEYIACVRRHGYKSLYFLTFKS
jgi:hypothetical protein